MLTKIKHLEVKLGVRETLNALQRKHQKGYSYPSQETILRLLKEYHGIEMSVRTLNRRLKEMVAEKMIHRIPRHIRAIDGSMIFRTTAYYILQQVVGSVKKILRSAVKMARYIRLPNLAEYSLTTKRDIEKDSALYDEQVPLEWISAFRMSLKA